MSVADSQGAAGPRLRTTAILTFKNVFFFFTITLFYNLILKKNSLTKLNKQLIQILKAM